MCLGNGDAASSRSGRRTIPGTIVSVLRGQFNWFPISGRPTRRSGSVCSPYWTATIPASLRQRDWLVFDAIDDTFDPPEQTVTFRRLFFQGAWDVLDVWFCYRVDASRADDPEVQDMIALFDREVRQAVIDFPVADEGAPAEVPA